MVASACCHAHFRHPNAAGLVGSQMTIPNGQTGLRSDPHWLVEENKSLREQLKEAWEQVRIARQQFRALEDQLEQRKAS